MCQCDFPQVLLNNCLESSSAWQEMQQEELKDLLRPVPEVWMIEFAGLGCVPHNLGLRFFHIRFEHVVPSLPRSPSCLHYVLVREVLSTQVLQVSISAPIIISATEMFSSLPVCNVCILWGASRMFFHLSILLYCLNLFNSTCGA